MTEIRKGVKEDFLEQLFVDYGNRKKNSIIYKFYSRENDRYLEEILENPLKAEKAGLKSLLYAEYRFRKQELSCYDFLQEMFTDLGENSTLYRALIARPHYQRDEEELSNKDREELSKNDWARILFLITPYLILFLGMESAEIGKLKEYYGC